MKCEILNLNFGVLNCRHAVSLYTSKAAAHRNRILRQFTGSVVLYGYRNVSAGCHHDHILTGQGEGPDDGRR